MVTKNESTMRFYPSRNSQSSRKYKANTSSIPYRREIFSNQAYGGSHFLELPVIITAVGWHLTAFRGSRNHGNDNRDPEATPLEVCLAHSPYLHTKANTTGSAQWSGSHGSPPARALEVGAGPGARPLCSVCASKPPPTEVPPLQAPPHHKAPPPLSPSPQQAPPLHSHHPGRPRPLAWDTRPPLVARALQTRNPRDFRQVLEMRCLLCAACAQMRPFPARPAVSARLCGKRPAPLAVTSSAVTGRVGNGASRSGLATSGPGRAAGRTAPTVLEASPVERDWAPWERRPGPWRLIYQLHLKTGRTRTNTLQFPLLQLLYSLCLNYWEK